MFGKSCNQTHSTLFLKYLLEYIRGWAEQFPTYSCIKSLSNREAGAWDSDRVLHTDSETEFL